MAVKVTVNPLILWTLGSYWKVDIQPNGTSEFGAILGERGCKVTSNPTVQWACRRRLKSNYWLEKNYHPPNKVIFSAIPPKKMYPNLKFLVFSRKRNLPVRLTEHTFRANFLKINDFQKSRVLLTCIIIYHIGTVECTF